MVQLMVTSSKRAHATRCVSQVCCSQRPCPRSRPSRPLSPQKTLRHFKGSSGSVSVVSLGPGMQKLLFEPSNHLWRVWGLILNVILPLPLSCWGLSFALGCGFFFFFLVGSNILLLMVVQQRVAILESSQRMGACPSTPPS